jgi:hypothetical protein
VSNDTSTSHIVSTSGSPGTSYKFRVRALNVYGWGSYSNEFTLLNSDVPAQMQVVTTSISGTNFHINFVAPSSNGETISGYSVMIE